MNKKNINVLIVKKWSFKDVGCVKIVIISFFAIHVMKKEINLKVYMRIHIKNSMFLQKCFDKWYLYFLSNFITNFMPIINIQ